MAIPRGHWVEVVRPLVAGRRIILAGAPLAALARQVDGLHALGAERCLVVAGGLGTGDLPPPDRCEWLLVDVAAADQIAEFRRWEVLLADPPTEVVDALDRFDPDSSALVLLPPVINAPVFGGRAVYGARRPEWVALEDKTTIDARWDRWGVPHPPCRVVPVADSEALASMNHELDRGAGTVWAGDARDGFNGGAVYVRWVRDRDEHDAARLFFKARCDRVRVTPFVEGIPCSIHGMVFPDHTAVFRPVELIVLRSAARGLLYGGVATYWDPPPADRTVMRDLAARVGDALRSEVNFRGLFTIDGILSTQGFVATELNPRWGAGVNPVTARMPEITLVHYALVAGEALDYEPVELEQLVVARADRHRGGGGWLAVGGRFDTTTSFDLVAQDGWRLASSGEEPDARLQLGPPASGNGGFAMVLPEPDRTPVGPALAPRVADILAFADRELDAGIELLKSATSMR